MTRAPTPRAGAETVTVLDTGLVIERLVAEGRRAVVWQGRWGSSGRMVAVKQLAGGADEATLRRFQQEAEILSRLDHPGIVPLLDVADVVGARGATPALVLPWAEGGSLADAIRRRGPLLPAAAALQVALAAEAVDAAHRVGVLHLDLKASNLLLPGPVGRLWVSDFGAARFRTARITSSGWSPPIGTVGHVAPEVAAGGARSPASDVFGLGATLWELAGGRLDAALADVAGRALAVSPGDRPSSAAAMACELRVAAGVGGPSVLREEPFPAPPTVELGPLYQGCRRRKPKDSCMDSLRADETALG